jgi:hypothetical protein
VKVNKVKTKASKRRTLRRARVDVRRKHRLPGKKNERKKADAFDSIAIQTSG